MTTNNKRSAAQAETGGRSLSQQLASTDVERARRLGMNVKTFRSRLRRGTALDQPLKKRSTNEEIAHRRATMLATVAPLVPVTVRQIYYQMSVHHPDMIANDDNGYDMTADDMKWLRESGKLPYQDVIDNTRRVVEGYHYDSVADALDQLVEHYRPNIWLDMPCLVWMCIEKDALAGTIDQICLRYQVPLLVVRGYSSLSFLHEQALKLRDERRPAHIYLMGDHDPEGCDARRFIEGKLREFAPKATLHFHWLAVNDETQITELGLPIFAAKEKGSRAKAWGDKHCAELDAIAPDKLRQMVTKAINKHMSKAKRDELIQDPDELDRVRELIGELRL